MRVLKQLKLLSVLFLGTVALGGCTVGPQYKRPEVVVPPSYRGGEVSNDDNNPSQVKNASLANEKWWEVFADPELQKLIREALQQNYDVRIAAERVLEAKAQVGITRAQQFPTLNGGASSTSQRTAANELGSFPAFTTGYSELQLSAAWQLDFWGLYRRQTESARAQLLASDWAQKEVVNTLIMDVATDYLQLRTLDEQLDISKRTVDARKDSLQLTKRLEAAGSSTLADVRQAEELLFTATAEIPQLEQQIQIKENQISTLLGKNPGPIPRGNSITNQSHAATVPAGLPSELLERRPDIRQAEQLLVSANAQVGVARAQFFPQIGLTGSTGTASDALLRLFSGPAFIYTYSASLTQPLFEGGKLRNNLRLTEAQKREQVLTYQKTISQAFQDVSNALISFQKSREYREEQEKLTEAGKDATRLARLRYNGGRTSYLEVLTTDTSYFSDELNLATARQNEALALVQLYNALGGGWE